MKPLKFKQIRKSIINQKESFQVDIPSNKSPLKRNLFGQIADAEMSFKNIKQSTMSPLKNVDLNILQQSQISTNKKSKFLFEESSTQRLNLSPLSNKKKMSEIEKSKGMYIFDSDRKTMNYQRVTSNFGSQQKENQQGSIYPNHQNKQNLILQGASKFNFIQQKERKINTGRQNVNDPSFRPDSSINQMCDTSKSSAPGSLTKKNSSSMLFKAALQTSNKKKTLRNNLDSERQTGRQSSISKLKQRLFGMKRLISQKQNKPSNQLSTEEGQQTKSFSIYTTNIINPKNSSTIEKGAQRPRPSTLKIMNQQTLQKQDETANFQSLVVASINKGMKKSAFKHFLNVDENFKKQNISTKQQLNESRLDSVNISVAESCDSILDMSPNL